MDKSNVEAKVMGRQKLLNDSWAMFRDSLPVEDVAKLDAISQACKILEAAQVPFWLFAEQPCALKLGTKERGPDQYVQYNWSPRVFGTDGGETEAGIDFAKNHIEAIFYSSYGVMTDILCQMLQKEVRELTWEEISDFFRYQVVSYAEKQRELI